jgi:hypothetical protein
MKFSELSNATQRDAVEWATKHPCYFYALRRSKPQYSLRYFSSLKIKITCSPAISVALSGNIDLDEVCQLLNVHKVEGAHAAMVDFYRGGRYSVQPVESKKGVYSQVYSHGITLQSVSQNNRDLVNKMISKIEQDFGYHEVFVQDKMVFCYRSRYDVMPAPLPSSVQRKTCHPFLSAGNRSFAKKIAWVNRVKGVIQSEIDSQTARIKDSVAVEVRKSANPNRIMKMFALNPRYNFDSTGKCVGIDPEDSR